ncbi:MAG: WD40/YVTN/BNR-like repeat-containing protein [Patescibacteria group bacterium]
MEKIRFISLLALVFLFSGCSLPSKETAPVETGGPNLTPSSIYQANDGGSNWLPLHDKTLKIESADILSMAVSPTEGVAIFGLAEGGILRTSDKGQSFEFLSKFKAEKVYGLEIDPTDSQVIYASGVWEKRGKIYKTQDQGETWKEIYTEPADGPLVISLAISQNSNGAILASDSEGAVFRSADKGETWKKVFQSDAPITKIISGKNSASLFLIAQGGRVYRGNSNATGFSEITKNIFDSLKKSGEIFSGELDSKGNLYLGGEFGLAKSSDNGNSWSEISILNDPSAFPVRALAINPKKEKEIIFGAARAVYRSNDGGESWSSYQLNNSSKIAGILKFSPVDTELVYLGLFKK